MTVGKHRMKSFMTLEYNFSGVRIMESNLIPVNWSLKVDLVAANNLGATAVEVETTASQAYQKIYYWLDTNLPNVLAVNVNNEDDLYIANLSSNIMMYCPGSAHDAFIIQLLHSKIVALVGEDLFVGEIELSGNDTTLKYTFDSPDGNYKLPKKTSDYYPGGTPTDETPWWSRDDGFCFEFIRPEGSTETDEELFGEIIDPMDEFENIVRDVIEINVPKEPARIVQIERWQPKKV